MRPYSFLVLSFNDELHLSRLFDSIIGLNASIYVLDSGSTDRTLEICKEYGAEISFHPFENHPKQWHIALHRFNIETPWVIALDADQIITNTLYKKLNHFDDSLNKEINGIYFNRKNYYKGKWIRHGGYFPFYLLKMFRLEKGMSDLNENMDHRFLVTGKTIIWKNGYLLEENLKECKVSFWIEKHNRYSDQVALEEVERMQKLRTQITPTKFWASPNERKAYLKRIWWKMPRYLRPTLYFSYRIIIQRGFLDGKTGIIFHFLQAFWFRLIVDVKIDELLKQQLYERKGSNDKLLRQSEKELERALDTAKNSCFTKNPNHIGTTSHFYELKFAMLFLLLFAVGYGFNIAFIGVTAAGGIYFQWIDQHLNYIRWWRDLDIQTTKAVLKLFGYQVHCDGHRVMVSGYSGFKLVYSCLGYGIMSFYTAFVIAFPGKWKSKIFAVLLGITMIQALNIIRFILIAIFWKKQTYTYLPDHHIIFNTVIYIVVLMTLYLWTKQKTNYVQNQFKKRFQ